MLTKKMFWLFNFILLRLFIVCIEIFREYTSFALLSVEVDRSTSCYLRVASANYVIVAVMASLPFLFAHLHTIVYSHAIEPADVMNLLLFRSILS